MSLSEPEISVESSSRHGIRSGPCGYCDGSEKERRSLLKRPTSADADPTILKCISMDLVDAGSEIHPIMTILLARRPPEEGINEHRDALCLMARAGYQDPDDLHDSGVSANDVCRKS